jgi:type II secretory pathway pseudopilin PulG
VRESGFTLIELFVLLVIIGVLLAMTVPSYLGFKDRARETAAGADVRSAIPAAEAYHSRPTQLHEHEAHNGRCDCMRQRRRLGDALVRPKTQVVWQGLALCDVAEE